MPRRTVRPFGQSTTGMRLVSMIMALVVVWALYRQVKDPTLWRTLFDQPQSSSRVQTAASQTTDTDTEPVLDGPDDRDEGESEEIQKLLELVTDRVPLKTREMEAYWKLMDWSRSQPFAEFRQRAKSDVPFTQLWEQPDKYRGQPIRLRLHVRRVLEYEAPENPLEVRKSYEAWGWTDESRSFPYAIVFTDPPRGLPIGTDVRAEVEFVGYFLKIMTYTAFDNARGAPLLVGKVRLVSTPTPAASIPARIDWTTITLLLTACLVIVGLILFFNRRTRKKIRQQNPLPSDLPVLCPNEDERSNELDEGSDHPVGDSTAVLGPASGGPSRPVV